MTVADHPAGGAWREQSIEQARHHLEERLVVVKRDAAELVDDWLAMLEGFSDEWPAEELKEWHRQLSELDAEAADIEAALKAIGGDTGGAPW